MTFCCDKDFNELISGEVSRGARFVRGRKRGKLYMVNAALLVLSPAPGDRREIRNGRGRASRAHCGAVQV